MRRLTLPIALLVLTGTLVAQTPQSMPLTQPNKFQCKVSFLSRQDDGDKVRLKDARLEFEIGVTVSADELTFDKTKDGTFQLSGNVQVTLKKN